MEFEDYKSDLLSRIDRGLKFARSLKVDAAEIFLIKQHELKLIGISGLIQSMNGGNIGVACRCLMGKKVGFASSSGISDDAVHFAVEKALKHANSLGITGISIIAQKALKGGKDDSTNT